MRTHIDFTDNGSNIFAKLATISNGLVKEGLQIEASKIAKVYKRVLKAEEKSDWSSFNDTKYADGKKRKSARRLTLQDKKARFGAKHSRITGEPEEGNISDHIKFYTPKEINKLYAVIGGGHPTFYPVKYENGVPVGFEDRQTATTRETLEMLDGLNDGKTITITEKMRNYINATQGIKNGGLRKSTKKLVIKPRKFAETARARGAKGAIWSIKKRYEQNFPKAVANIKIKETRIESAS